MIGMADGLTVPFALAAGLTGIAASSSLIVTAGIAEIVAGSVAMGLGGYLAGRTELEHYLSEKKREILEIKKVPELEKQEIRDIFATYGVTLGTQNLLVEELARDEAKWVDFMMRFELDLKEPSASRPRVQGGVIGGAYAAGGIIPLAAYIWTPDPAQAFRVSIAMTLSALFLFGWMKTKLLGGKPWVGALQISSIGGVAAAAAYFVTSWLS